METLSLRLRLTGRFVDGRERVLMTLYAAVLALALGVTMVPAQVAGTLDHFLSPPSASTSPEAHAPTAASSMDRLDDRVRNAPVGFVPNDGQVHEDVEYLAQGPGYAFHFTEQAAVLSLDRGEKTQVLDLRFLDGNDQVKVVGLNKTDATVNHLKGSNPKRWHTALPTYSGIVYRELWPGIDMRFAGRGGKLKYEFLVAPGAQVSDIGLAYDGARSLSIGRSGQLLIDTPTGGLVDAAPSAYQSIRGRKVEVSAHYAGVTRGGTYGFRVGATKPGRPVVIDPAINYSTFLGGSGSDEAFGIAIGGRNAYVTGSTISSNFPATPGVYDDSHNGDDDVFVAKLNSKGSDLVYSTFIGGPQSDVGEDVGTDGSGHVYVTGETASSVFPTTDGSFDEIHNGGQDVFVAKLNAKGTTLVYSTFLGGGSNDQGRGIAVNAGNAYVTGVTSSSNFPTTEGAFDEDDNLMDDAFVTSLNSKGGELAYSTYLGGSLNDVGRGIALRGGFAYVTGYTFSPDFPTTPGSFDPSGLLPPGGLQDAYVAQLNPSGSTLVYSTYLGGSLLEEGFGIEVGGSGNAFVTGSTTSTDFPTTDGAADETHNGKEDVFVTKLNSTGSALVYSTYVGGTESDVGRGISLEASGKSPVGEAQVTGATASPDFPTANPTQAAYGGGPNDAFLTELNDTGTALTFSTFLGGAGRDNGRGVATHGQDAYVSGFTTSSDFVTTPGAYDENHNGSRDAFVTRFEL